MKFTRRELLLVVGFYLLMTLNYYVALLIDLGITTHYRAVIINHALKALLSIPIFLLITNKMKDQPWWQILLFHFSALLVFTFVWVKLYYAACDYLGIFRSTGPKVVWDYYLTGLFYAIQFGGLHLYIYNQQIKETNLLMAKISRLKSESELSALKSQLNPHFLYNVFNTISSAIPKEAKPAREMINILADILRYQLQASRQGMVLIQDELRYIGKYLELEKERFGSRLAYQIEVIGELGSLKMPPTLLQPIVENSIKHGISPTVRGGDVVIRVEVRSASIDFEISDSGIGVEEEDLSCLIGTGIGMTNTNERLIRMYGANLLLQHNQPQGLKVKFSVPRNE